MTPLTLQEIAVYAGGHLRQGDPGRLVQGIGSDSRHLAPGELFLALRGENFDGHRFVSAIADGGALGAIVESGWAEESDLPTEFALIEVPDTLLAYQKIAAEYRRSLPCRLVAITGSNGKTSTKDFVATVLGAAYRVCKTDGNLNNHIGVPRTLLRIDPEDDFAVVEMGMNHPGEIAPLARLAAPDVAVITNIGTAHIEYMGTRAAIAKEKGSLVEAVGAGGFVVLPAEDEFTPEIAERTRGKVITVGFGRGDFRAANLRPEIDGTRYTLTSEDQTWEVNLPVHGRHMVLNSLLAIAVGSVCGVDISAAVAALSRSSLTKGRLEMKRVCGLTFLDDSYNANPDSMVAALETLARIPVQGKRVAILGRMGELGTEAVPGNRRVGVAAAHENIDQLLAVGADAVHLVESARAAGLEMAVAMNSLEEVSAWLRENADPDDLILLKGSRSAGMERVLALLSTPPVTLASQHV